MSEITYKILGSIILLLSAILFGLHKIKSERNKLREISAFLDMVNYVESNIEHYNKPLPDIFEEYSNEYFTSNKLLDNIRAFGINAAIADYSFSIASSVESAVKNFACKIGLGYTDDELNLCKYTYNLLKDSEAKLRLEMRNTEKMYLTIPVLLALSVILILI